MDRHSSEDVEVRDIAGGRSGDDSPPLVAKVRDPAPATYGGVTSMARTLSAQYIAFLQRHREVQGGN